ncbi:MAG: hypothetical protein ACFB3T_06940 [Geminicoccaceae bacterium]
MARLFGFIRAETDIVAMSALVLSLVTASYNAFQFFRGPQLSMVPLEQVTFLAHANTGVPVAQGRVMLSARVTLTNRAIPEYIDFVTRSRAHIAAGDIDVTLTWQFTGETRIETGLGTSDAIRPFAVPGRATAGEQIVYAPHPVRCEPGSVDCDRYQNWVRWRDFMAALDKFERVRVTLEVDTELSGTLAQTCVVRLDEDVRRFIKDKVLISPVCEREPST